MSIGSQFAVAIGQPRVVRPDGQNGSWMGPDSRRRADGSLAARLPHHANSPMNSRVLASARRCALRYSTCCYRDETDGFACR
jgi:hypothetical protein